MAAATYFPPSEPDNTMHASAVRCTYDLSSRGLEALFRNLLQQPPKQNH